MKCVSAATEPGRASAFYADPGLDVWSRSRILCMAAHCPLPTLSVRNRSNTGYTTTGDAAAGRGRVDMRMNLNRYHHVRLHLSMFWRQGACILSPATKLRHLSELLTRWFASRLATVVYLAAAACMSDTHRDQTRSLSSVSLPVRCP